MKQMLAGVLVLMLSTLSTLGAQQAATSNPPQQIVPNLRFDVSIVDEGGGAPTTQKVVAVIARANNQMASVRSHGRLNPGHPIAIAMRASGQHGVDVGLSVDARGTYENGKVQARVAVEYQPYWPDAKSLPSSVTAQLDAVFDEGRKMLIAQAADPLSDRKTTIEVTVTVVK
jgi:hypothetical protein